MRTQAPVRSLYSGVALLICLGWLLALPLPLVLAGPDGARKPELDFRLVGFATVNALGQDGTTGGEGGQVVTVDTAEELLDYISRPGPYVIRVAGHIALPSDRAMYHVTSDKTIVGLGSSAVISGAGLNIGTSVSGPEDPRCVHNVIIRNIRFTDFPDDGINVQYYAHHIWIDHNEFDRGFDGAVDIKRGSDYITVSWNYFHDHDKTMLLGHSDGNAAQDVGHLRVTYHHNWFDGTIQRHPRVRFGEPVHVFNNYYLNIHAQSYSYGVASQMNAGVVVEGNYFENVPAPMRTDVGGAPGRILARNNIFVNSGQPVFEDSVVEPSTYYDYTLDDPADVPEIVMRGAGINKIHPYGVAEQ